MRLSRTTVRRYEPVRVVVTDPRRGEDALPGPVTVVLADAADRRYRLALEPTGRPGEWAGRFTPMRTGRYTGTAILERRHEKDIGLVPGLRVRGSRGPGFLALHPRSRRALAHSDGSAFFPVGVRIAAEELLAGVDWSREVVRLRALGANTLELPVPPPGSEEEAARLQAIDRALFTAERVGRFAVRLRLEPSEGDPPAAWEAHARRIAARWGCSPALAIWSVRVPASEWRTRLIRALREADIYRHLIAAPDDPNGPRADLILLPPGGPPVPGRPSLAEGPSPDGAPAAGAAAWAHLASGGVGLPLLPYRPGAPAGAPELLELSRLAEAARAIPFHAGERAVTARTGPGTAAVFRRYGPVLVGWVLGGGDGAGGETTLVFPSLRPGTYGIRAWSPAALSDGTPGPATVRAWQQRALRGAGGQGSLRLRLPLSETGTLVRIAPVGPAGTR